MKIVKTSGSYVPEKLKAPFGFKGGFLSELWQVVCRVESERHYGVGVGVQSVLWSDAAVFTTNPESVGNQYMYEVTTYALKLLEGAEGETPIELIDGIYEETLRYARGLTNVKENLRETFVRNALVAVDNALWQLYAKEKGTQDFMALIPEEFRAPLCEKHDKLCNIPLVTYGVKETDIKKLLDDGTILMKIKIGFDDNGKMSKAEMLEWDKKRLEQIHRIAKSYTSEYTQGGKILYYLDANGKYDSVARLESLLGFAKEIGALERIVLLEEPFEEENKVFVGDMPVRIAADESVHSLKDVEERIALGYKAITLKPIAKTLSETLKILKKAWEKGVVCFCADLTVNPLMVEWNKNVAARIGTLPEMKIGILESNGEQNYVRWEELYQAHPCAENAFARCNKGLYSLNEEFFAVSGGIFKSSSYYDTL
ncbi:MAG: L-alanine-DL-glutamate epimerase [Clostridiales bacterium]|nr:L-alanine-DL-glutamate epimerase [Clostridiales bacterium]